MFLSLLLVVTMLPGGVLKARADDTTSNSEIADLPAGSTLQFAGKLWTLLDPSTGLVLCDSAVGSGVYGSTNEFKSGNAAYDGLSAYYSTLSSQERALIQSQTWATGAGIVTCKVGLLTYTNVTNYGSYIKSLDQDWFLCSVLGGGSDIFYMKAGETSIGGYKQYESPASSAAYRPALYLKPHFKLAYDNVSKYCLIDVSAISASDSGYTYSNGNITLTGDYTYVLYGKTLTNTVTVPSPVTADVILADADIESGSGCAFSIDSGASGNLTLNGESILKSTTGNAGLKVPGGAKLTLTAASSGMLTAIGGVNGAGIGGANGDGGTVTINGGTVTATGGQYGAGIGGGSDGRGCSVTISGGTVTALGGEYGVGIGGGRSGDAGTVTITRGTVAATGGLYGGVGIYAGTVTITGAGTSVTAKGRYSCKDIGGGGGGAGGILMVGDKTSTATSLPIVNMVSTGTNAVTTFANCVINNNASAEMTGTYNRDGYVPVTVGLVAAPASDSKVSLQATVSKADNNDTYDGAGTVTFSTSSDPSGAYTAVDGGAVGVSTAAPATSEFTSAGGKTYTIKADYSSTNGYRKGSNSTDVSIPNADASLKWLGVNAGELTPEFSSGTTDYTVNVGNGTTNIRIKPNANDSNATVKVNGETVANLANSSAIPLADSGTKISIVVTAQAGDTKTYMVTVHRASADVNKITVSSVGGGSSVKAGVDGEDTLTLKADVEPPDAIQDVGWIVTSQGDGTAEPNPGDGKITVSSDGTATFTGTKAGIVYAKAVAEDGSGVYGLFSITVTSKESVTVSSVNGGSSIFEGDTLQLLAEVTGGSSSVVTWAIDTDGNLNYPSGMGKGLGTLTDNKDGKAAFSAKTAGCVYVTATANGVSSNPFCVYIYQKGTPDTEKIEVSSKNGDRSVVNGGTLQMNANVTVNESAKAVMQNVTWSVKNGTGAATIDPNGLLTGSTAGTIKVTAKAKDGSGVFYSVEIMVTENGTAPTITILSLSDGTVGTAYSQTLAATGDTPITWNVQSGDSLPDGLNLDSSTGIVSGTPTIAGNFIFTVQATNNHGNDTKQLSIHTDAASTNIFGISLNKNGAYIFTPQTVGYSSVSPLSITVSNTGNQATGDLTVALSGTTASSFTLSKSTVSSIAAGGTENFTVAPKMGLPAGTYTAMVTVSGSNVTSQAFTVSFTVNNQPTYGISFDKSSTHIFTAQTVGYITATPLSVTVSNTGNQATGDLTVALSGTTASSFTLSKSTVSSIAAGGTESFTIVPKTGLLADTYTATVTVSGSNGTSQSFTVSFTVNSNGSGNPGGGSIFGGVSGSTSYQATAMGNNGLPATLSVATSGGNASVTLGSAQSSTLQGGGTIAISMPTVPNAASYVVNIRASSLSADGGGTLTMNTAIGNISVPTDMLSSLSGVSGQTAQITISQGDSSVLSSDLQAKIGGRPTIRLTLSLGETKSEWSNPDAPVTVSIPYTPTAEEKSSRESIVVWYIDGNGNAVCVPNGHYDAATGTVTFKTTHFSQYSVGYNSVVFSDVSGSAWYKNYVNYLAAREIVGGTGAWKFSPDANITRAEFVTILTNLSGNDLSAYTSSSFSDVSTSAWYFAAVQWAYKNSIASGNDGTFNPNANITREQMAVMLFNYAKYAGIDVSNVEGISVREFSDYGSISNWAMTPIQWAINSSIISGNSDGSFAPTANATREQAAKLVALFLQGTVK